MERGGWPWCGQCFYLSWCRPVCRSRPPPQNSKIPACFFQHCPMIALNDRGKRMRKRSLRNKRFFIHWTCNIKTAFTGKGIQTQPFFLFTCNNQNIRLIIHVYFSLIANIWWRSTQWSGYHMTLTSHMIRGWISKYVSFISIALFTDTITKCFIIKGQSGRINWAD